MKPAAALTSATTPFSSTPVSGDGLALVRPWASVNVASCGSCHRHAKQSAYTVSLFQAPSACSYRS